MCAKVPLPVPVSSEWRARAREHYKPGERATRTSPGVFLVATGLHWQSSLNAYVTWTAAYLEPTEEKPTLPFSTANKLVAPLPSPHNGRAQNQKSQTRKQHTTPQKTL